MLLAIGGCAAPDPRNVDPIGFSWVGPNRVAECSGCYEPTFAFPGAPAILTDANQAGVEQMGLFLYDKGAWVRRDNPHERELVELPAGRSLPYDRADTTVYSRSDGRLYTVALVGYPLAAPALAIEIAWSNDLGITWSPSVLVELPAGAGVPDRPWLAFDEDVVYLVYQAVPNGIWIASSSNGGQDWSPARQAVGVWERGSLGGLGQPVVKDGQVIFPYTRTLQELAARSPVEVQELMVAVSSDGGGTFQQRLVSPIPAGSSVNVFPQAAANDEHYVVAWAETAGGVWTSHSPDGVDWSTPRLWAEQSVHPGPWILQGPGGFWLFYFANEGGTAAACALQMSDAPAPTCWNVVNVNTDFAHAAASSYGMVFGWSVDSDGVYAVTWQPG